MSLQAKCNYNLYPHGLFYYFLLLLLFLRYSKGQRKCLLSRHHSHSKVQPEQVLNFKITAASNYYYLNIILLLLSLITPQGQHKNIKHIHRQIGLYIERTA